MRRFIDAEYIDWMTGIEVDDVVDEVIELAHVKAEALLDNLEEETTEWNIYMTRGGWIVNLPEVPNTVTEVKWRRDQDYQVIDSKNYRVIGSIIKTRQWLPDNCDVVVTYTTGIPSTDDAPELVKLLLVYLYLDIQNSLQPGSVNIREVESQKIGDYSVKYHLGTDATAEENTIGTRIKSLVNLILNGSDSPGVSID